MKTNGIKPEDARELAEYDHWKRINRLISTMFWPIGLCVCMAIFIYLYSYYCEEIESLADFAMVTLVLAGICFLICLVYAFCFLANFRPGKCLRVVMFVAACLVLLAHAFGFALYAEATWIGARILQCGIVFVALFFAPPLLALLFSLWNRLSGWRFAHQLPERRAKKLMRLKSALARKADAFLGRHSSIALNGPKEFIFISFGWSAIVVVSLLVLLTAYFHIGGIEWGDWTIPNEAGLRLEKRDVPDEDNAYIALMALTNLYHVADNDQATKDLVNYYGDPSNSEDGAKRAEVRRDPASHKRAARILADHTEFFDKFRAALSLKGYADIDKRLEDAKRAKEDRPPWVSFLPRYKPFIDFAKLVELRAQVALDKGDVETAVSAIGEIHALGQLLMVNSEMMVGYLVGILIEKISFVKMCDVVATGKATDSVAERLSKMVAVSEANAPMAWERAIKAGAAMSFEGDEWICNHAAHITRVMLFRDYGEFYNEHGNFRSPSRLQRLLFAWTGFDKFAFHRREMLYRQAMLVRAMLSADDDLMEMILNEIPRNLLLPHGVGNDLTASTCPILSPYARSYRMDRLRPRLVLAAEKWRRAHGGENPPTLDALVPEYISAVPSDPWDKTGRPLKYDASLGVVWSVGRTGRYDYQKVAKARESCGGDSSVDNDTRDNAFRLDGQSLNSLMLLNAEKACSR